MHCKFIDKKKRAASLVWVPTFFKVRMGNNLHYISVNRSAWKTLSQKPAAYPVDDGTNKKGLQCNCKPFGHIGRILQ